MIKDTEGDAFLPGWRDVQKFSAWPPYQVLEPYFPFNNKSVEDFTVGTEDCEDRHGKCNGKLKPGTIYWFKVTSIILIAATVDYLMLCVIVPRGGVEVRRLF